MPGTAETIWMDADPKSTYHDLACQCERHCRHCFEDLDQVREVRTRMIARKKMPAAWQLGPRECYCSPYCRGRAKRERAFDRYLSRNSVPQA
jgi:hypothetical protein